MLLQFSRQTPLLDCQQAGNASSDGGEEKVMTEAVGREPHQDRNQEWGIRRRSGPSESLLPLAGWIYPKPGSKDNSAASPPSMPKPSATSLGHAHGVTSPLLVAPREGGVLVATLGWHWAGPWLVISLAISSIAIMIWMKILISNP